MKKRIGIQGALVFAAAGASFLFSTFLFARHESAPADNLLDILGAALALLGFLFRVAARGHKWETSDSGKNLVVDGPYKLVRNPMYFGTMLIGLGVILVLFKLWLSIIFIAVFALIYAPEIAREERKLSKRFGGEYKKYAAAVPAYFPNLKGIFKTDFVDCLSFKWAWFKKELLPLGLTVAALILAEIWIRIG